MNRDIDYVGYSQDPHQISREFLFRLQDDNVYIDVYIYFDRYDQNCTWKVHNSQKRSIINITLANQNLVSGVTAMRHIWNQLSYSVLRSCNGVTK